MGGHFSTLYKWKAHPKPTQLVQGPSNLHGPHFLPLPSSQDIALAKLKARAAKFYEHRRTTSQPTNQPNSLPAGRSLKSRPDQEHIDWMATKARDGLITMRIMNAPAQAGQVEWTINCQPDLAGNL